MTNIKALLNPMSERRLPPPFTPIHNPRITDSPNSSRKKARVAKDAAIFNHAPINGEVRFPPDEYQDDILAAHHQQFEVTPFGEIADYPRHIPYNAEKKQFAERTNRTFLEVFQYTFKIPGDDTPYPMLWDYNIGLVRTTPLFKCTGHSKTTPAKMLNKNPGLKEICHSLTGGALVAQGYWIPYAAAKAIAATFCYDIRYALTPVFGHDFPEMCIEPTAEGFGDMTISPAIIKYCTEEAQKFRREEPMITSSTPPDAFKQVTPTPRKQHNRGTRGVAARTYRSPYDSPEIGTYDSENSSDDNYTIAPSTPPIFRNPWQAVNRPKTPPRSEPRTLPSPRSVMAWHSTRNEMTYNIPFTPPPTIASRQSSVELSPTSLPCQQMSAIRSTCDNVTGSVMEEHNHEKISGAIDLLCTATGLSKVEIVRRLDVTKSIQRYDERLDAAISMESLRTGMKWREVVNRIKMSEDGHKRSASW